MQKIMIETFGPISYIDLELNKQNTTVLIGSQASGKSTLSKTIYFCRKIKDFLLEFITDSNRFESTHVNERYTTFLKTVRRYFMNYFGTTKHMENFRIEFIYDFPISQRKVVITLGQDKYVRIFFSGLLKNDIENLILEISNLYSNSLKNNSFQANLSSSLKMQLRTLEIVEEKVEQEISKYFCDSSEIIYIPAGRSLIASLSEQLIDINETLMDKTMQDFITRIRFTRNRFGTKIPDMVSNYLKTIQGQIQNADVEHAYKLIRQILKADYISDNDGEKLYYDDKHWVKLMYGSSGQQESLWILLLIFTVILENRPVFMVIEEPEAHLYPSAQKTIVDLIALMSNSSKSEVFITTHSPYILTSFNLLLHSAIVENHPKNKYKDFIVRKQLRIDPKNFNAFQIERNSERNLQSLVDQITGLVNASKIDAISEIINVETERLIDLEIQYDM